MMLLQILMITAFQMTRASQEQPYPVDTSWQYEVTAGDPDKQTWLRDHLKEREQYTTGSGLTVVGWSEPFDAETSKVITQFANNSINLMNLQKPMTPTVTSYSSSIRLKVPSLLQEISINVDKHGIPKIRFWKQSSTGMSITTRRKLRVFNAALLALQTETRAFVIKFRKDYPSDPSATVRPPSATVRPKWVQPNTRRIQWKTFCENHSSEVASFAQRAKRMGLPNISKVGGIPKEMLPPDLQAALFSSPDPFPKCG